MNECVQRSIFLIFLLYASLPGRAHSLKWIVSFATIYPRFPFCNDTIISWLNQTQPPDHILIFVTSNWDSTRTRRVQTPNVANNLYSHSHSERLRRRLSKNFFREFSSGLIQVIEVPLDYGPATKFIGVLMSINIFDTDYWIVCDDDLIYNNDLIERYSNYYTRFPADDKNGPIVTFFQSTIFNFEVPVIENMPSVNVPHVQGADSYAIPHSVLLRQSRHALPLSYAKFPLLVDFVWKTCSNGYLNDDYTISYAMTVANVSIINIREGFVYKVNDRNDPSELHLITEEMQAKFSGHIVSCLRTHSLQILEMWNFSAANP